ncbi:hypothetical protein Z968_02205 [Clostridium novyi A str. 4552]|uniref:HTH marR-type domain-containing protein n=1 Tax=Clostridium novyi A str. 4552 TaxID=1444289 RepID=A0A0A0IA96_CLONO|nr:MarR family transcriptional regulator [Clostridium novyi]KGM97832.1 hypothetical protein Z968_02205 [Clostridium novyi A str. 4552]
MDKKEIIKKLPRQFLDTVEQFNITDKQARNFGTDIKLHLSEIHLIQYIGNNYKVHISEIARGLNITKGAVSQMVKKLEKKGCVEKILDSENRSRTIISLTSKGKSAYMEHEKYHEKIDKLILGLLKDYSESEILAVEKFLKGMEKGLK